jgi:hypothetical protein
MTATLDVCQGGFTRQRYKGEPQEILINPGRRKSVEDQEGEEEVSSWRAFYCCVVPPALPMFVHPLE